MIKTQRTIYLTVLGALWAAAAGAQTRPASAPAQAQSQSASTSQSSDDSAVRPATTTASGDTGLWYVPTAEVLAKGKWSVSGYRQSFNYKQGFSNVADFPLT